MHTCTLVHALRFLNILPQKTINVNSRIVNCPPPLTPFLQTTPALLSDILQINATKRSSSNSKKRSNAKNVCRKFPPRYLLFYKNALQIYSQIKHQRHSKQFDFRFEIFTQKNAPQTTFEMHFVSYRYLFFFGIQRN